MGAFTGCRSWFMRASTSSSVHPRLRVSSAHDEWNHVVLGLIAMKNGYLEEEGFKDFEMIGFPSDEDIQLEALNQGIVDIIIDPATHKVLAAIDKGADLYLVAPRRKHHNFVFFGQKGMQSFADLKGMTIEMVKDGEPTSQFRQLLRMAGLDPDKDVNIVFMTSGMHDIAGYQKDFLEGKTPLGILQPWQEKAVSRISGMGYPLLADSSKIFPPRQDRIVAAVGSLVRERPDTLKAFLKAYIRASSFLVEPANAKEIRAMVEEARFLDDERDRFNFDTALESLWHRVAPDGTLSIEGLKQVISEQRGCGYVSDKITLERVLRIDPLLQAQRELGIKTQ